MKSEVEARRKSRDQIEQIIVLDNRIRDLTATKEKLA
jgi:hypothetical protein